MSIINGSPIIRSAGGGPVADGYYLDGENLGLPDGYFEAGVLIDTPSAYGWNNDLVDMPTMEWVSLVRATAEQAQAAYYVEDGRLHYNSDLAVAAGAASDYTATATIGPKIYVKKQTNILVKRDRSGGTNLARQYFWIVRRDSDGTYLGNTCGYSAATSTFTDHFFEGVYNGSPSFSTDWLEFNYLTGPKSLQPLTGLVRADPHTTGFGGITPGGSNVGLDPRPRGTYSPPGTYQQFLVGIQHNAGVTAPVRGYIAKLQIE